MMGRSSENGVREMSDPHPHSEAHPGTREPDPESAIPASPKLPDVDSPPPEDVLEDVPSTEEIIEHAQSAEKIVEQQPSPDELLRRKR